MSKLEKIKKVIKPQQLLFLIILLASNTFAWFIYSTRVKSDISAHVNAWDVLFEAGDSQITDYVDVNIDNMYPGMADYNYVLKAHNKSEVGASVTYKILNANIMGTEYITTEGREESKEAANAADLTSDGLITKLATDYPFKITFNLSDTSLDAQTGEATYIVNVVWPFESGDDAADTLWGVKASQYKKDNPDLSSITMKVK